MAEIIGPIIKLAIHEASYKGGLWLRAQIMLHEGIRDTESVCSRIIKIIRSFN